MDKLTRIILYNQYKILKELDKSYDYDRHIIALEYGIENAMEHGIESLYLIPFVADEEIPESIVTETINILTMFDRIKFDLEKLSKKDRENLEKDDWKFLGFDANNESEYLRVVTFLIKTDDHRFKNVFSYLSDDCPNTHCPMLEYTYRPMIQKYENMKEEQFLMEQIKYILEK